MNDNSDFKKIRVDDLDQDQPLGRYLILLFIEFEKTVIESLKAQGIRDIGGSDLNIIRFLKPNGSQAIEIARLAGISKQAVGKQVASLEQRKYLVRKESTEDGRAQVILFTKKGEALLRTLIDTIRQIEDTYQSQIGTKQYIILKKQLKLLFDHHKNFESRPKNL